MRIAIIVNTPIIIGKVFSEIPMNHGVLKRSESLTYVKLKVIYIPIHLKIIIQLELETPLSKVLIEENSHSLQSIAQYKMLLNQPIGEG